MSPRFFQERDNIFFQRINHELVDNVMEVQVIIFKLLLSESPVNLYGEAPNKVFRQGVAVMCRADRKAPTVSSEGYGINTTQTITFDFQRETLKSKNFYVEIGDIIEFDEAYFEVTNTNETQLLSGQPGYKHSLTAEAHMVRRTALQLEEPNS